MMLIPLFALVGLVLVGISSVSAIHSRS